MQLSDYCLCIIAADLISSGLVNANPVTFVVGVAAYFIWEKFRKWEISNNG